MRKLLDFYANGEREQTLEKVFKGGDDFVFGASREAFSCSLIASFIKKTGNVPPLLISFDPLTMQDNFEEFGIKTVVLPELDKHEEFDEENNDPVIARRVDAIEKMLEGAMVIATPVSASQRVPKIQDVMKGNVQISIGDEIDINTMIEKLVDNGYKTTGLVEGRGECAVRGCLLDIYPIVGTHPFRIEFFGDEVDTIRKFDSLTQESFASVSVADIMTTSNLSITHSLWDQLDNKPILFLSDSDLDNHINVIPKNPIIRFARQLEPNSYDCAIGSINRLQGDIAKDCGELVRIIDSGTKVIVYARHEEAAEQMRLAVPEACDVKVGRISSGFYDLEENLICVHDFELMHRKPVKRKHNKVLGGEVLSSLSDLKTNDIVVHITHGISKFKGMKAIERKGFLEDFLELEFAEDTKMYIPVTAIDLIQKYIGERSPELSKIGGTAWAKKRKRAEKSIEDLTCELLDAQAERIAKGGISFDKDDKQTRKFESIFSFEETEDQLSAYRTIKTAMETPVAMDCLLCGDVGFGKTEVAIRAAFKAVKSGYQVAVLSPTTILSEQHSENFIERFEGFGVEIACMNRFRTTKEVNDILEETRKGNVDILIGTHAILNKKLSFDNLGLLIVDEEQRFGVKQKEHIKQIKSGVDILTLSATPIPRTLHQGMLGIKEVTVLSEAPAERLSIETRVSSWDKELIKNAMEREIKRDGQIFFVHNRVNDLYKIAAKIKEMLPDISLEMIHGQMPKDRISSIMQAYKFGSIKCLLATSIIESGIDFPNANTLIVNNAHYFGLSELHQIRGRIGRFTRQAYAYFIVPPAKNLAQKAIERLDAIQEYTELGAGFKLAMRDLELRGAGNILGKEQSGHIEAIGYELYCRLLNKSIESKKNGEEFSYNIQEDTKLALSVHAYISDDYLEVPSLKFELHKSIDDSKSINELSKIAAITRDRYGPMPEELRHLFFIKAIKIRCKKHKITTVGVSGRKLSLSFKGKLPNLNGDSCKEIVFIEPADKMIVLHLTKEANGEFLVEFLCRLFDVNMKF